MNDGKAQRKEVLEVIRSAYSEAFPAEKKIMDYIVRHPREVCDSNVASLAKLSGVSEASVVRMCHHLGYEGYSQFRLSLARDLGRMEVNEGENYPGSGDPVTDMFAELSRNITAVGKRININDIIRSVELIKNAEVVHVIAVGNTTNVSQYVGFRLGRIGIRTVQYAIPVYFLDHIGLADPRDVVIAISQSGLSQDVLDGIRLAKEKGIKVIGITEADPSPLAQNVDITLLSSGRQNPGQYQKNYSLMNEFAVADVLISFLINDDLLKAYMSRERKKKKTDEEE